MSSLLPSLALFLAIPVASAEVAAALPAGKTAERAFPAFGSKTPELKPGAWIRGEAPKNLADGKLRLIFCWSTLSPTSVKAAPAMNDLFVRYRDKGLDVLGVSVWEESETTVREFLRNRGDALAFPVAFDGRDAGTVSRRWLEDTGINGIPYVFVVRGGRVLWHGQPEEFDGKYIPAMLDGSYDSAKAESLIAADQAARERAEPLFSLVEDLRMERKFDEALAKCDELERMLPERDRGTVELSRAQTYFEKGDFDKGYDRLSRYVDAHYNDPDVVAMTALSLVADGAFEKHRNHALATRYAERALAIAPIDAYRMLNARVSYSAGDTARAKKIIAELGETKDERVRIQLKPVREAIAAGAPWPIEHKVDCACGAH